jgi:hypothetical protein
LLNFDRANVIFGNVASAAEHGQYPAGFGAHRAPRLRTVNSARSRNTITTNRIWNSPGKPPPGTIRVLGDASRITDLRMQIGKEDRIIRIASTFITTWLSERGYSRATWVKKMEAEFGLKRVSGILGGGTDMVGAKEQLIELDMNHTKLSGFIE